MHALFHSYVVCEFNRLFSGASQTRSGHAVVRELRTYELQKTAKLVVLAADVLACSCRFESPYTWSTNFPNGASDLHMTVVHLGLAALQIILEFVPVFCSRLFWSFLCMKVNDILADKFTVSPQLMTRRLEWVVDIVSSHEAKPARRYTCCCMRKVCNTVKNRASNSRTQPPIVCSTFISYAVLDQIDVFNLSYRHMGRDYIEPGPSQSLCSVQNIF